MQISEHVAQLAADGPALAQAADVAGWDARVTGTEWSVRELVTHTGGVHRWAADIVRSKSSTGDTEAGRNVGSGPADAELLSWFRDGHAELVEALATAPPDLDCFTFLPAPSPLAFWARRQAHETAIHRADAERAARLTPAFDVAFAQDGIDEILTGFAQRRSNASSTPATICLRPTDEGDAWAITFGGERIVAERASTSAADLEVVGESGDLYLWLWNRPSQAEESGDAAAAELWRRVQVRWG